MKKYRHSGIKSWPLEERPRERLFQQGEHLLTKAELLAILLGSGNKDESALELARRIIKKFKTFRNMSHSDLASWQEFKGIGAAKLARIRAALEIARRIGEENMERGIKFKSSQDVASYIMPRLRDLKKEVVKVLYLDSKNRLLQIHEIVSGTINKASPIIREIMQKALELFSSALICVHNHPSGDPYPSTEDRKFTHNLKNAGEVLDVMVLDHLIIGDNIYFSFADHNLI